jgi:hypothetical protein
MATFKYKITHRYAAGQITRYLFVRHLIRKEKEKLQRRKVVTKSRKVLNAVTNA